MNLLDVKLPGDLTQETGQEKGDQCTLVTELVSGQEMGEQCTLVKEMFSMVDTPSSSASSFKTGVRKRKRSGDTAGGGGGRQSPAAKQSRLESWAVIKQSRSDDSPETLRLEMAKKTSARCQRSAPSAAPPTPAKTKTPSPGGKKKYRRQFDCEKCGKQFEYNMHLTKHQINCVGSTRCLVCPRKSSTSRDNLRHMMIHVKEELLLKYPGEKPFCKECDIQFEDRLDFNKHLSKGKHKDIILELVEEKINVKYEEDDSAEPTPRKKLSASNEISTKLENENDGLKNDKAENKDDDDQLNSQAGKGYKRERKAACNICQKQFVSKRLMKSHIISSHFKNEFKALSPDLKCSICKEGAFQTIRKLASHFVLHHDKILVDKFGDRGYSLNDRRESANSNNNIFQCPKCNCSMGGSRFCLRYHLLSAHFKDKILRSYPDQTCTQCPTHTKFDKNDKLLKHFALKHEKILVQLLDNEGLQLPPKDLKKKGANVTPEDDGEWICEIEEYNSGRTRG